MKKIILIDGGPRKNMNTASLADAFADGIQEAGSIEIKRVRLYELKYRGCMSCLACKLKGRSSRICLFPDDLKPLLEEVASADGLAVATPIYMGDMTAQTKAFLERLVFPWLSYENFSVAAPKRIPVVFLYTMNASEDFLPMLIPHLEFTEKLVGNGFDLMERVAACFTAQVKDYSRYEMAGCDPDARMRYREAHWSADLKKASDSGRNMAKKILAE